MFELHITCTKDIDKLSIDFSDGTSIIQESSPKPKQGKQAKQNNQHKELKEYTEEHIDEDILLDDIELYNNKCKNKKEVIKPLELPDIDRPVNVDNTLQNLEF